MLCLRNFFQQILRYLFYICFLHGVIFLIIRTLQYNLPMRKLSDKTKGALLCILGGTLWGLSGSIGQYLFTYQGMTSSWLVPVRLCLAGVLMTVFCMFRYRQDILRIWKDPRDWTELIVYGLFGISFCQFCYLLCIQNSSAASATMLQNVSPVMILVYTCLQAKRKPYLYEIVSILLAIAGLYCFTTHGDPGNMAVTGKAVLIGLASASCVMIYNCVPRRILKEYPTPVLQMWAFLMGGLFFSILFRIDRIQYTPTVTGLAVMVFSVIIGNMIAFVSYMNGVRLIGPKTAILYAFTEPVTAALISAAALKTPFTGWDMAGLVLEFLMLYIISTHTDP